MNVKSNTYWIKLEKELFIWNSFWFLKDQSSNDSEKINILNQYGSINQNRVDCDQDSKQTKKISSSNNPELEASKNLTRMIISTTFLYVIGHLPYSIYYFITRVFKVKPESLRNLFIISQFSLYLLIILKIFIYYFFNKLYRLKFNNLFKKKNLYFF